MKKLTRRRTIAIIILSLYAITMLYHFFKPLPENISYESPVYQVSDEQVSFFYNLTGKEGEEKRFKEQIFKRTGEIIDEAEDFIVLDYFLFNSFHEKGKEYPEIASFLTKKLLAKKKEYPDMKIIFITDEVNTSYSSHKAPELDQLKKHGVEVVYTDVDPLRDSTPMYSAVWRMFFQWFGQEGNGWLPNAFADLAPDMTARSYLQIFNAKANHRKTITTEKTSLVSSANPHDASGKFANIAFEVKGALVNDMLVTEKAAVDLGGDQITFPEGIKQPSNKGDIDVQLLTEGKIQKAIVEEINRAKNGHEIWIAMFYLADRDVIDALTKASNRGAEVNIILDPNKNSFGQKKTGLPNIPMSEELLEDTNGEINIRWYKPAPEQFHSKMIAVKKQEATTIIGGSANHTSRNLRDFNLETNVLIHAPNDSSVAKDVDEYFKVLWNNDGAEYTADYEEHNEKTAGFKRVIYSFQELLRLTTY